MGAARNWQNDEATAAFVAAVGKNIRVARVRADLPLDKTALEAGLHAGHLSSIERGRHNPSLVTLKRIAEALDVPMTTLLQDAD
jgi:transcriptional regulator with XRE-family HTH domain